MNESESKCEGEGLRVTLSLSCLETSFVYLLSELIHSCVARCTHQDLVTKETEKGMSITHVHAIVTC